VKTLKVSAIKPKLGKVLDAALEGAPFLVSRPAGLVLITRYVAPEPIPLRPPGYFDKCHTKADGEREARLLKRSVKPRP
jgi:hypothetical protein